MTAKRFPAIKIEWTLPGWYKSITNGSDVKLVRIAPADSTRIDVQKIAGDSVVNFYFEPPAYMEVIESSIFDLPDYGDD